MTWSFWIWSVVAIAQLVWLLRCLGELARHAERDLRIEQENRALDEAVKRAAVRQVKARLALREARKGVRG